MGISDGRVILRFAGLGTCISKENRRFGLGVQKESSSWLVAGRTGDCVGVGVTMSPSISSSGEIPFSTVESKGALKFFGQPVRCKFCHQCKRRFLGKGGKIIYWGAY